jgi:hypothetical protein
MKVQVYPKIRKKNFLEKSEISNLHEEWKI